MNRDSTHNFSVVYHPEDTDRQGVSAKSLAVSLAGFAELFDAVEKEIGQSDSRVELAFKASRAGSVECVLDLIELGLPAGAMIAPGIGSYANEIRRLVIGDTGLFALIPRLRKPSASEMSDPGVIVDESRTLIDKEVAMKHPQIAELALKKASARVGVEVTSSDGD